MSLLIVGLDSTIVNLALPSIRRDLNSSVSGLQWTIDAYTLVLASLLILAGTAADRFGRRRVFQLGLSIFTLASLLCSLAPNLEWLIAFRVLQAVGASMLNPVALSIITNVFTEPTERARAMGVWSGVIGLSMALGPVVGGALLGPWGWRAIFWINLPLGVAALTLTARFIPESRAPTPRRFDPVGQVLIALFLASLTFGIIEGPHTGWTSPTIAIAFVVAACALAGILAYEPRLREPLLDLRFFHSIPFSGAILIAISAFAALGSFLLLITLYLQQERAYSPLHAGLLMLPMAVTTVIAGPLSGRLVGNRGARPSLLVAGTALLAAGLMLSTLTEATSPVWLIGSFVVFGLGFGAVNAPINNTAVSGMPREQAGVAAATTAMSRQVGVSLGVALTGTMLPSAGSDDLVAAARPGWWFISGCGAVVLSLALLTTTLRAQSTAAATAARLMPEPEKLPS